MTRLFFNSGNYPKNINLVLFLLRVGAGIFMLSHGWGKLLKLIGDDPITFADPLGVGDATSLFLTVFAEVFCSILLILGLTTRLAAFPSFITMMVAAFVVHAGDGFGKMELALLYGVVYLAITIAGPGKFSIDHLVSRRINSKK